ncbi:hypothetical protein G7K_6322-t1 [Saitoella complicata NRRL Y-17804]|uniref:Secreted protein n=1 Tax=Saitoella complicata (strain BCRC 22490 / CBS 7301 / JCM 7358 / NBRC 10748 / NRRL Y-17804) TaxID=698492 RepID=A0A0E9NRC4_SAICN|nr:hypothetical protein G7K_6322-t1 [Saitoella complicata NRRL Y-17804]
MKLFIRFCPFICLCMCTESQCYLAVRRTRDLTLTMPKPVDSSAFSVLSLNRPSFHPGNSCTAQTTEGSTANLHHPARAFMRCYTHAKRNSQSTTCNAEALGMNADRRPLRTSPPCAIPYAPTTRGDSSVNPTECKPLRETSEDFSTQFATLSEKTAVSNRRSTLSDAGSSHLRDSLTRVRP